MNDIIQHFSVSFRQRHTFITTAIVFLTLFLLELIFEHSFAIILAHLLVVFLLLLFDLVLAGLLAWLAAEPMAIYTYLHKVRSEQKPTSKLYTPLTAAKNLYETPTDTIEQVQRQDVRKLVRQLNTHLLILGLPGAGKTMALRAYQYPILEHPTSSMWRQNKIPVYVPLKDYNVFLGNTYLPGHASQSQPPLSYPDSILSYLLYGSELTGMNNLKPYLPMLAKRGRLLFLCDGMNEIDSHNLNFVCTELMHTMQANQNRLLMTCRELDYREQPMLRQLVAQDCAEEALILPLKMEQIAEFVEHYVQSDPKSIAQHRYSAHEINEQIKGSRLSYNCTNPMMLVTLIRTIDEVGIDQDIQIGTKGRLLHKFVFQLVKKELQHRRWKTLNEQDIVLFLSQVACTARLNKLRNAIQLGQGRMIGEGGTPRHIPIGELADKLHLWLVEHSPPESSTTGPLAQQMPPQRLYTPPEIEQFIGFAQSAALVNISQNGVLSFSHELIAEYFAGAYLHQMDTTPAFSIPFGHELVTDIGSWSEPVAIWAGMSDNPMELARRLANLGQSNTEQAYSALSLSLTCAGVVWTPAHTHSSQRGMANLPDNVTQLLVSFVPDPQARSKLAETIRRSADQGGVEVYRSLLPLIMETGIDDLLVLLDPRTVPELLFDYLRDAIDTAMPPNQIERIVHILGRFGPVVIPRAVELSQAHAQRNLYLRVEALHILGRTHTMQAIRPLIRYLGDPEQSMREAAVKAIVHLGPGLALEAILEELKNQTPDEVLGKIHWSALAALRGFLTKDRLNPLQYQHIIEALLLALSSRYMPSIQEETRHILLQQADPTGNTRDDRWKRVIEWLIRSLADRDETKTSNAMNILRHIGKAATPLLLTELKTNGLELVRARIVEILGAVRDPEAMQPLLPYLADSHPLVQQQVAIALRTYAPESIPFLINMVVYYQSVEVAGKASHILKEIGQSSVAPVIQALETIKPERTQLLVAVLVHVKSSQAIRPLINLLKKLQNEPAIAAVTIDALSQFPDKQVVPPLVEVLTTWESPHYERASQALSSLGELAFDELVTVLDVQQEMVTTARVRHTLLNMNPFLSVQLLSTFKTCSEAQARQIELIFHQKEDTAPFLVEHLSHEEQAIREHVFSILNKMDREKITPPLLEALKNPKDYAPIARLLLTYPQSIPSLVHLLSDPLRSDNAYNILLDFGIVVIPSLVPGLDHQSSLARKRAQDILITLVRREQEEKSQQKVLTQVTGLFAHIPLSQQQSYAWDSVLDVLVNQFPDQSISVLLEGLEHANLQNGVAEALVRLIHKNDAHSAHVRKELLAALRTKGRRDGASSALVKLDAEVVDDVSELTIDNDSAVALKAQDILSRIGAAALPFVWSRYRDDSHPQFRDAARNVFRNMPTEKIKDRLVELLISKERLDVEMALTLLLERMLVEDEKTLQEQKMIPALLEHIQVHSGESSNLRIIALLLLQRKEVVIKHMCRVLYSNHPDWLTQVFLLLAIEGKEAKEALRQMLNDPQASPQLRREVAGVMGMMKLEIDVGRYATALSRHSIFANQPQPATRQLEPRYEQLEISLRALGGLLASGKWDTERLQKLLQDSPDDSSEHDLYSVLLGKQYSSEMKHLDKQVRDEREAYKKEKRDLNNTIVNKDNQIYKLVEKNNVLALERDRLQARLMKLEQGLQPPTDQGAS